MKKQQQGFTIVELMIATAVFSVVMIICLAAFLRVGQLYYKGIYLSRTQEAARNISDDIVNQLRLNGQATSLTQVGSTNVFYMCAGNKRYTMMSNNVVDSSIESAGNFGLVRDNIPAGGCASPADQVLQNPVELLGDKMRVVATPGGGLDQSDINDVCSLVGTRTLCTVKVHVDFGDDDLLANSDPAHSDSFTTNAQGFVSGICSGPLQGTQFCATSDITTKVYPLQ